MAAWKRQPWNGGVFVGVSIVAAIVYLQVVTPAIGVAFEDAALNYPFAFFFWGMASLSFFENWPFRRAAPACEGVVPHGAIDRARLDKES